MLLISASDNARSTSDTATSSFTFMIWPATEGLTGWKTVAIRFLRPKALSTPLVLLERPIEERISVILKKGIASWRFVTMGTAIERW